MINFNGLFPRLALASVALSFSLVGSNSLSIAAESTDSAPDSVAGKQSPPAVPAPRPFKMPVVEEYQLPNGMNVQLIPDKRTPMVTFGMGIKSGASQEPRHKKGLADVTAGMLNEGTKTSTSREIAEEIDFIGGGMNAGSDADFTLISGSALSQYTDRLFGILSDVILNPVFPEEELKLQKTNITQGLIAKRSDPGFLLEERFAKVVFGDHPYGTVLPTPEHIASITRNDLIAWHQNHFLPNETYLVVVGDFEAADMKALIEKTFGSWKPGKINEIAEGATPKLIGKRIYLVDRPGSVQSNLKVGNMAIKRTDPDYFPLLVANQILGGGGNARLFLNLREQKSFTYGAYSGFSARREPGAFAASTDVRTEVTAPALKEVFAELQRIRETEVPDKELQAAKNYLVGSYQLGLETQGGIAQRLLDAKIYNLPKDYLERYSEQVIAVSPKDVNRVARKYMDLDNVTIAVVGDASKVRKDLLPLGPIEMYDIHGKVVVTPPQEAHTDAGG